MTPGEAKELGFNVWEEENGDYVCYKLRDDATAEESHIFRKRWNMGSDEEKIFIMDVNDDREYIDLSAGYKCTFAIWHGMRSWSIMENDRWKLFVEGSEVTDGIEAIDLACPTLDSVESRNKFSFDYLPPGGDKNWVTVECVRTQDGRYVSVLYRPGGLSEVEYVRTQDGRYVRVTEEEEIPPKPVEHDYLKASAEDRAILEDSISQ